MPVTEKIELLPINSYELEGHLTNIGNSLLDFGKIFGFSEKCFGVTDCDFLQSIIIEFTSEIKTDFIAYYSVDSAALARGSIARIEAGELPESVKVLAIRNAQERELQVINSILTPAYQFKSRVRSAWLEIKDRLYVARNNWRVRQLGNQRIEADASGKFRLLMSTLNKNTIFTLTPVQDRLNGRDNVTQLYLANKFETYQRLLGLGYSRIVHGWAVPAVENVDVNDRIFDTFLTAYFENAFPYGKATLVFKKSFSQKLRAKLNYLAALYPRVKAVLESFKPHAVLISSCSTADGQLLIHLCQAKNIRLLEMTHGMFQDTPLLTFQNVPTKLVWCARQHDLMQKYRPDVSCPVIGNPKHDELLANFRKKPPVNSYDKPYVLFASTPGNNISISWITYVRLLQEYSWTARCFPDLLFILKLHPSEDIERIKAEARAVSSPDNLIVEQSKNIYELIFHAEIVMVLTSTVGFEALLWDKKLICYSIPNSDKWLPFGAYNLAKTASTKEELKVAVEYFLKNESLTIGNPSRDYFAFSDGKALDKILTLTLTP